MGIGDWGLGFWGGGGWGQPPRPTAKNQKPTPPQKKNKNNY